MAEIAIYPTLSCLSSSFSIHAARRCMLTSKGFLSPPFQFLYKKCIHFTPGSLTTIARHSSHAAQSAISGQYNLETEMVEDAVEETQIGGAESSVDDIQFVEAGYICNVHGLRGEVRVKPATDFPEERFMKPGVRWLRLRSSSTLTIKEFELVKGRFHAGQHQWLVTFKGVNSVDEARELVGAALLVKNDDRPTLNEDEFYSPDLVGMGVVLKDTRELVGTVIDIYNTGASDLLRVMLIQTKDSVANISAAASEEEKSAPLIWIPFVKEIVPDVDMQRRQLLITPPEGLLELNLRPKGSSKGEKREEEWKQRRKARQKITAIRKKLLDIGQEHVLFGLSDGDKAQKQALLDQILSFDFKLFKHALQDSSETYQRWRLFLHLF